MNDEITNIFLEGSYLISTYVIIQNKNGLLYKQTILILLFISGNYIFGKAAKWQIIAPMIARETIQ